MVSLHAVAVVNNGGREEHRAGSTPSHGLDKRSSMVNSILRPFLIHVDLRGGITRRGWSVLLMDVVFLESLQGVQEY